MNEHVSIVEVGPRDGLQNEQQLISTADKIELVNLLSACGVDTIEVTSFVSPKWVPQMADAAEVMAGIKRNAAINYAVLTPNLKGYQLARAAKASEVAIFAAASETFSQKNINCSIAQSLARFTELARLAGEDEMPIRGYVSCVVNCPYEGVIQPRAVADVVQSLFDLGCYEVSLGDTTGKAEPAAVDHLLDAVLKVAPAGKLAGHFHDTASRALDNIDVCLERGLRRFDAAAGGLGGCPYAPGAKGNVATSKVLERVQQKGYHSGIDMTLLNEAEDFIRRLVN